MQEAHRVPGSLAGGLDSLLSWSAYPLVFLAPPVWVAFQHVLKFVGFGVGILVLASLVDSAV